MVCKFEVGKEYIRKSLKNSESKFIVTAIGIQGFCFRSTDGVEKYTTFTLSSPENYREWREPRSIEPKFMLVLENASKTDQIWLNGTMFSDKARAEIYYNNHIRSFDGSPKLIDIIMISYTEKIK